MAEAARKLTPAPTKAPGRGRVYDSITDTIGDTPLVRLEPACRPNGRQGDDPGQARILQPDLQRQGPHRRHHDRRAGSLGRAEAGRTR